MSDFFDSVNWDAISYDTSSLELGSSFLNVKDNGSGSDSDVEMANMTVSNSNSNSNNSDCFLVILDCCNQNFLFSVQTPNGNSNPFFAAAESAGITWLS